MDVLSSGELGERVGGWERPVDGSDAHTVEFLVVFIGRYRLVRVEHVSYHGVYISVARFHVYGFR